jgi:DNA mismatch repair ATPase MutS
LFSVIDEATPKLAALSRVADGTLLREVEEKRPHCHRIWDIANRHLWQWLQQGGVDGPDAQELRDALANLGNADQDFFQDLEKFAKAIQEVASIAAQLAMNNQRAESLALLAKAAPALFAARKKANSLALQLTTMQTDFQRRALGLPPE